MPRPTKLTDRVKKNIISAIRAGLSYERAALFAGISESTFYNWKERGEREGEGIYFEFLEDLKKAEIEGEVRNLAIISKAAEKQWQAAAWLLERRYPDLWGRVDVKHTGKIELEHTNEYKYVLETNRDIRPEVRREILSRLGEIEPDGEAA